MVPENDPRSSKGTLNRKQTSNDVTKQDPMNRSQSHNFKKIKLNTTLNAKKFMPNNEVNNTHESIQTKKGYPINHKHFLGWNNTPETKQWRRRESVISQGPEKQK